MAERTPRDTAHAAMQAHENDTAARLRFYERVADAELFVLLEQEAHGPEVSPLTMPLEGENYVLAFDREERLAAFVEETSGNGQAAPHVALSGRALVQMLAGQRLGLGLNLAVAPSSILLPAEVLDWLKDMLSAPVSEQEEKPLELASPVGAGEGLLQALATKLASAAGLAREAWLCSARFSGGCDAFLMIVVGAPQGAHRALAKAVSEAVTFCGEEGRRVDVSFLEPGDPLLERVARVGLRFDLPAPEPAAVSVPAPPGSDPANPPRLR